MLSNKAYFKDHSDVALTTSFQEFTWDFNSVNIFIASDSGTIEYSLNGTDVHGRITVGKERDMQYRALSRIYLRGAAGAEQYRLEAY